MAGILMCDQMYSFLWRCHVGFDRLTSEEELVPSKAHQSTAVYGESPHNALTVVPRGSVATQIMNPSSFFQQFAEK